MGAKTLNERLAGLTIIDPETSEPISVNTGTLLRYLNQPNQLEIVISKIRTAASTKYKDAITSGIDTKLAALELQADLAALDKLSEELWNGEAMIKKQAGRFRGVRDAATSFRRTIYNNKRPSTMRIGMIELNDKNIAQEPTVIQIDDDYDVQRIGTLRSDTDVVLKGDKTATHIRIHLTFQGIEELNNTLRNLLAQCRASPIIPIESDLLIDVMINKFATPEAMNFMVEQARLSGNISFDDPLEKLSTKAIENFEALKDLVAAGDAATLYGIAKARYDFARNNASTSGTPAKTVVEDRPQYGISITATLQEVEIKSDPDGNHKVDVVLHFRRVNENAYTNGRLQWRQSDGMPTFDITKCLPLRDYYQAVYLSDQGDRKQTFMPMIPDKDMNVNCPLIFRWKNYFTGEKRELNLEDTQCSIHTISIGWRNKLSFMPLIGQHNPAVQYLGSSNSSVRMQLITTDREIVRELSALKDELDQARRDFSTINRDERVFVTNGLINLVSANEFLISGMSITTDPRSAEIVYINITMVESKYSLRDRERVSIFQDYYSVDHLRALWNYIGKVGEAAVTKLGQRKILFLHEAQVIGFLFGTGVTKFDYKLQEDAGDHRVSMPGLPGSKISGTSIITTSTDIMTNIRYIKGGRGINGIYQTPDDNSNGILNQHILAAGLTKYFTKGNNSNLLRWLHWPDNINRTSTVSIDILGQYNQQRRNKQSSAAESRVNLQEVLAFKNNNGQHDPLGGRGSALSGLAWTIQDSTALTESQSADIFRVFIGRDNFTDMPWFNRKFWDSLFNVIMYRKRDENTNSSEVKWSSEHLAKANSYLIGLISSGVVDEWSGFDQSEWLGNNKFAKLGDKGSGRPGSNYPDMYLPSYAEIFSEDPILANEGPFPGIPELEPRVQDSLLIKYDDVSILDSKYVVNVIDGDTIIVIGNEKIRLAGIQAPEINTSAGVLSQGILQQIIDGKEVQIELAEDPLDKFGRTLAYIWLGDVMINQYMIAAGFAKPIKEQSNHKYQLWFEDTERAKRKVYGSSEANGFNRGRILPIWRTFCPRWRDLGIKPPFEVRSAYASIEEAQNQLARTPADFVEPGFFYWRSSWKDQLPSLKKLGAKTLANANASKQYTITLEKSEFTAQGDIQDTLAKLVTNLLRDGKLDERHVEAELASDRGQAKNLLQQINKKDTDVPVINFIDKKGRVIAYAVHAPGSDTNARTRHFKIVKYKGHKLKIRNPYDSSVLAHDEMIKPAGMAEVAGNMVDDHFSPARAYPTYRVYAIEEDREQLVYSDDFYGVNCLSSIEIHHSKKNTSLAVLRITNTTGAFENDAFIDLDAEYKKDIASDDEGEAYFSSFRFRTGTLIQVRMGYTSKAEDLPIVFSGRVVETQFGPVITLICQGHRAEMLQDIDMVVTTMDPFQILSIAFGKIGPAPSLGRNADMGDISQKLARETLGAYAASQITKWGKMWNHNINSHLRNVYLQSNSPVVKGWLEIFNDGLSGEYKDAQKERIKRFFNWIPVVELLITDESLDQWICPQQPMWNMIQELARHIPGTIAQVVPFEQDGTLFFGKASTPYIASNPTLGEKRAYTKMYDMTKKLVLTDLSNLVLNKFLKSRYFATFEDFDNVVLTNERVVRSRSLRGGWNNIVKTLKNTNKIKTNQDLFLWANKSYQHATNLLKPDSKSGIWNAFDFDLHPSGVTAKLDFTGDLKYITSKSPGLFRYMFGFWFGLSASGIFPGTLETDYMKISQLICSRLKNTSTRKNDWTPAWKQLVSEFIESPNSSLNIKLSNLEIEGNKVLGLAGKMSDVITESQIELSEARKILINLEKTGRFPQKSIDLLREQMNKRQYVLEEFGLGDQKERDRISRDVENNLITILGGNTDPGSNNLELTELVRNRAASFRLFVFFMAQYLRETLDKGGPNAKIIRTEAINATLSDSRSFMLPPGWKQFRDYHFVTSKNDIIENKITATMEQMHNAVVIRHPHGAVKSSLGDLTSNTEKTDEKTALHDEKIFITEDQSWISFPATGGIGFRPSIGKEYRKLLVRVENNANNSEKAARCLLSNMAEALRPMYRGTLLIMGRVMKPYDVVHINDIFTDMIGPIEVDEVIHHFNVDSGWTTTIVPHALVHTMDNISSLQHDSFMDWISDVTEWYSDNWMWIELGLFATAAFTGGGSLAIGALIRGGLKASTAKAAKILGLSFGKGVVKNKRLRIMYLKALRSLVGKRTTKRLALETATSNAIAKTSGGVLSKTVKTILSKNPKAFFGTLGRFMNVGARTAQVLTPFVGVGSISFQALFATTHIKARWGNTDMPVDLQPLILKGRPFTAGLEYGYDDTYSFGEKFKGWISSFFQASADGVNAMDKLLSSEEEPSSTQQLLELK